MSGRSAPQIRVVALALTALGLAAALAAREGGGSQSLLVGIGAAAGFALYRASFGFTAAWRRLLIDHRSLGVRAQVIMIALTIAVFFPLLSMETVLGRPVEGFVFPVGVALAIGAFLFGIGMQLGGGCGSGTLFTAGAGNTRMWVTLLAFVAGSFIATADPLGWSRWPSLGAYSLIDTAGLPGALAIAAIVLGLIYAFCLRLERARHGGPQPLALEWRDGWSGPWSLAAGAIALAAVNIATLIVAGRPWGITSAFALWGAKAAMGMGLDPSDWSYWRGSPALGASLFADIASVMDFGVLIGALLAVGLSGRFELTWRLATKPTLAAILGGLMMGIGARLSTGCNIGAFFSGTASGSLHGVVWLAFAIPGNAIGARLRPWFRLDS